MSPLNGKRMVSNYQVLLGYGNSTTNHLGNLGRNFN